MKEEFFLKLNNSDQVTYVDKEDYERFKHFSLHLSGSGYVLTTKNVPFHRLVLDMQDSFMLVDYISGDKLDNRKSNLRPAHTLGNNTNRRKTEGCKNTFRGVFNSKTDGKLVVSIVYNKKTYHLGTFTSELKAILSYDKICRYLFGEFAKLNLPEKRTFT